MKYILAGICVIAFILSIRFLFLPGYFPMHDDAQVARVVVMKKALLDGQFPVRWVSDLGYGYGYPIFEFYGPLPYYVGGVLALVGMDSVMATKTMMGFGVLLGVIGMFIAGKTFFGRFGGLLSVIAFTFFPYRAVQLFVRGAIGELWATSFLPFVIVGFYFLFQNSSRRKGLFLGIFGLTGVLLSHTVLGLVTTLGILGCLTMYGVYTWLRKTWNWPLFLTMGSVVVLSIDLAAFFLLPAFFEMGATNVSSVIGPTADFRKHFVCISQFWSSQWGFGGSTDTCVDGMSFQLGKMHILLVLVSIIVFATTLAHRWKRYSRIWYSICLVCALASIFFMTSMSQPLWELFPYISFVQYPWRLLSISGVFIGLTIGALGSKMAPLWAKISGLVGIIILGIVSLPLFTPQYTFGRSTQAFEDMTELRFRASRVSDEYLPKDFIKPTDEGGIARTRVSPTDTIDVTVLSEKSISGEYELRVKKDSELTLSLAYFPGWTFMLDGENVIPRIENGKPVMVLSEGTHHLTLQFKDTPVRRVANVLSLVTLIVLPFLFYGKKEKR